MKRHLLFIVFLSLASAVAFNMLWQADIASAQGGEAICFPVYETTFSCSSNVCGGALVETTCEVACGGGCTSSQTQCSQYQTCQLSPSPGCYCTGSCYPPPKLKEVVDRSLQPKNVFDKDGRLKLPASLEWEDVNKVMAPSCTVGSYRYEAQGNKGASAEGIAETNKKIIGDKCNLLPDIDYSLRVQTCVNGNGTDCGQLSSPISVKTSPAPELLSPFDKDFEGSDEGQAKIPVSLTWCPAPGARSFRVSVDEKQGTSIFSLGFGPGATEYRDEPSPQGGLQLLNKDISYLWKVAACFAGQDAKDCPVSQLWGVKPGEYTIARLILRSPQYDERSPGTVPAINLYSSLEWTGDPFTQFYLVRLTGGGEQKDFYTSSTSLSLMRKIGARYIWEQLKLNMPYSWQVKPCAAQNESSCETTWSAQWKFRTAGAPPTGMEAIPKDAAGRSAIPTILEWDDMSGATTYRYQVAQNASFQNILEEDLILESKATISKLRQNETYAWRVKTCAARENDFLGKEDEFCGSWQQGTLATTQLTAPVLTTTEATSPSSSVSWQPVFSGNFYQYRLVYAAVSSQETNDACKNSVGKAADEGITPGPFAVMRLSCAGTYTVALQACIDSDCKDAGPRSGPQSFRVSQRNVGVFAGLVPCGTGIDNPSTPWNERESCGVGHLFLLVRNLIDFALWKLSVLATLLLAVATGAISYFSFGGPDTLVQIRRIWKAVGIGALILLFAWMLLNLLLGILGFNINMIGNWYEIRI